MVSVTIKVFSSLFDDTPEAMHRIDRLTARMAYYSGWRTVEEQHRLDDLCPYAEDVDCCLSPEACTA